MRHEDHLNPTRQGVKMGMFLPQVEPLSLMGQAKGYFIFDLRDARTGEQLVYWELKESEKPRG